MSDLSINSTAQEQLQLLLAEQAQQQARVAEIEAQIAALIPQSTSFQQHRIANHKQYQQHQQHPRDAPRSIPSSGATMARHLSSVGQTVRSFYLARL
jgi:hypothetical protein